MSDLSA